MAKEENRLCEHRLECTNGDAALTNFDRLAGTHLATLVRGFEHHRKAALANLFQYLVSVVLDHVVFGFKVFVRDCVDSGHLVRLHTRWTHDAVLGLGGRFAFQHELVRRGVLVSRTFLAMALLVSFFRPIPNVWSVVMVPMPMMMSVMASMMPMAFARLVTLAHRIVPVAVRGTRRQSSEPVGCRT